jgi:hypothetical protein
MNKLFTGLLCLLVGLLSTIPAHAVIGSVKGGAVECNSANPLCTPIALTVSMLCNQSSLCPTMSAPSFTNSQRFWGMTVAGDCKTTVDGGTTWAGCTTATPAATRFIAGAADGSVIAVALSAGVCSFYKSTDNGLTWPLVHTTGTTCNGGSGAFSQIKCLTTGTCIYPTNDALLTTCNLFQSNNSGGTWSLATTSACGDVTNFAVVGTYYNGTFGVLLNNIQAASQTQWITLNNLTWTASAVWPTTQRCTGGVAAYGGSLHVLCLQTDLSGYRIYTSNGALEQPIVLPGVALSAGQGALFASAGAALYVVATYQPTPTDIPHVGVWASRDSGVTFTFLAASSGAGSAQVQSGDIYVHNGCVYFSSGSFPSNVVFGKVCL